VVFNTIGLNDCPETLVKAETRAGFARLNGPRRWTSDGFVGSALVDPAVRTFQGLAMRQAGTLHVGAGDYLSAGRPYRAPCSRAEDGFALQGGSAGLSAR
jgi:hypothetical protein